MTVSSLTGSVLTASSAVGTRSPTRHAGGIGGIAMLSTYPPTLCGLATFTAALRQHLLEHGEQADVVRVVDAPEPVRHPYEVAQLVNGSPTSSADVARVLRRYDVVIVQHEYGIYGGPDGEDVLPLVEALREASIPIVTVLHTVLTDPTRNQRRVLERLLTLSDTVVTMTDEGRRRLQTLYGTGSARVVVIRHGAEDHRDVRPAPRPDARPLVLTWGLLGGGKGIEWAVDAMPALRDLSPRYLVAGSTHPKVRELEGERYREALVRRMAEREVSGLVELDATYRDVRSLAALVASADVVLLPYDSVDQVTSGVLVEAVAAGRPVVSTPFPHAVELLSGGAGLLIPRRDPTALAAALRRVLTEPGLAQDMAARAAALAPELTWSAVAARYAALAGSMVR